MGAPDTSRAIATTRTQQRRHGALSFSWCALLLALATGCGRATGEATPPPDAAVPLPTPDAATPLPAAFVLRNETGRNIYVQSHRHYEFVRDGKVLLVVGGCCGHLECGMSLQRAVEVAPGAEYAWNWDGLALSSECAPPQPVLPGPLTVRVHYSFTRTGDDLFSTVGATMDVDRAFAHPLAAPVLVVVR